MNTDFAVFDTHNNRPGKTEMVRVQKSFVHGLPIANYLILLAGNDVRSHILEAVELGYQMDQLVIVERQATTYAEQAEQLDRLALEHIYVHQHVRADFFEVARRFLRNGFTVALDADGISPLGSLLDPLRDLKDQYQGMIYWANVVECSRGIHSKISWQTLLKWARTIRLRLPKGDVCATNPARGTRVWRRDYPSKEIMPIALKAMFPEYDAIYFPYKGGVNATPMGASMLRLA